MECYYGICLEFDICGLGRISTQKVSKNLTSLRLYNSKKIEYALIRKGFWPLIY